MRTYEYRGLGRDGRSAKGLIEALSPKEAREKLAAGGILADRLSPTGRQARFPGEIRATFYRELGTLVGAGLPLLKAFEILIQAPELGDSRIVLAGVRDSLREGASLAESLRGASRSVTPFEHAIIEASERSASVEPMLNELADYLDERERLRERVQGALIYPSIVLTVGLCMAIVMLGVLLPRAQEIMTGSTVRVPKITAFMVGAGRVVSRWGVWVAAAAAGAALAVRARVARDPQARARWNRWLLRAPILGRGHRILVNVRFSRTLAILLRGGVPLVDAIGMAGRATGNAWVTELSLAAAEAVRHGARFSEAVRRIPPLADSLPGWIEVGEASGGLTDILERAARRQQELWDRFVRRSLSVLEPVLILAIGVFVLLVTVSVLLPVMSLSQSIQR